MKSFDVIVVGAGHAGCEAAYAAARLGAHVGLCTLIGGHGRAHAVQSRGRRHGEGPSGSRDRRARRADGRARSTRPASSSSCSIEAAAPRSGRRGRRRTRRSTAQWVREALEAEPNIEWLIRPGRADHRRAGTDRRPGAGGRRRVCVPRARRHDRHVPERPDSHRPRAASGRPRRRTAVARSRRLAEVVRVRMGPAEDRHAASARSREHRLRSARRRGALRSSSAATSRRCRSRSCRRAIERPQIDCYLLHTNDRVRDLVRANIDRSPLFNGQIQRHRPALLPVARRQDRPVSRQGAAPDLPRAGGRRRAGDLRQRLLDVPAARRPGRSRPRAARARRCRPAPAGLRGRVRLHPADRADAPPRDQARRRALSRRPDQRHVRLRGSGSAGPGRRRQRGERRDRRRRASSCGATRPTSASSSTT